MPVVYAIRISMLSVIIPTKNNETGLVRTLSALVPAAVEGLVREVIVIDLGSADQTHRIAEHAGCRIFPAEDMALAITSAKGEWIMFLEPGAKPAGEWMEHVSIHVSQGRTPARFSAAREGRLPFFQRILGRKSALRDGLIISKSQATALMKNKKVPPFLKKRLPARRIGATLNIAPVSRK